MRVGRWGLIKYKFLDNFRSDFKKSKKNQRILLEFNAYWRKKYIFLFNYLILCLHERVFFLFSIFQVNTPAQKRNPKTEKRSILNPKTENMKMKLF